MDPPAAAGLTLTLTGPSGAAGRPHGIPRVRREAFADALHPRRFPSGVPRKHGFRPKLADLFTEEILESVPHRHVVISLPRRLRPFFRRRKRLTRLARLAYETVKNLLQAAAGTRTAAPGSVACLQVPGISWTGTPTCTC
mgnify:CR=1 FL=1